ncbi:MAG: hypothetical protein DI591_10865 [Citromicrobium sp.]|nr:MAG: hypothetical protein DI591_10865 [Citromicrobium sp.]
MTHDPFNTPPSGAPCSFTMGDALEREAQLYLAQRSPAPANQTRSYLVADFEYAWNRPAIDAYQCLEGRDARDEIIWPFYTIATACWLILHFEPGEPVPRIEPIVVHSADDLSEPQIVARLFEVLDADPGLTFVTYGGEAKDLAVLRRCAASQGLRLPLQLRDLSPHCRERIDLCRSVTVQAKPPHLPELAIASGIPCKPSPSRSIGKLVENGKWRDVCDQCAADVLATTVLLIRHLVSHGETECCQADTLVGIAEAATSGFPGSEFIKRKFSPWAKAAQVRSRLKGAILAPV